MRIEHLEQIAYTWKMTYNMGVWDVRISSMSQSEPGIEPVGGHTGGDNARSFSCKPAAEDPQREAPIWLAISSAVG